MRANSALVAATTFCLRRAMAVPKCLSGQRRSAWSLVDWLEGPAATSKRSDNGVKTLLNLRKIFKQKELSNLQKLGIGGLNAEFGSIFRRAFASHLLPHDTVKKLGIKHVKGMLLYGPPGTGKTLVARQISKILNGKKDPKIVNGPELLNCYKGESERNIRKLFADAEIDQKQYGEKSDLHVIIFDEIDAICKKRSGSEYSFYNDGIVNTLLTTLDGVKPLDNVLVIGLTNRKGLLDEALLRPGRLEVHIELGLPDEKGRLQILQIHTSKIKESNVLAPDVNLGELATLTETYSGAELEGAVRSAVSFAINRQLSLDDLEKPVDEGSVKVTMDDFRRALQEIRPSNYGASAEELERCRKNGIVNCGDRNRQTYEKVMLLVEQAKSSEGSSLVKCLLEGPSGSGKSVLAASVGLQSRFPFIRMISSESMIGLHHEESKCAYLENVFQEAYKSKLSIIILDDIERLMEFIPNSSRFSTKLYQTLWSLLKSYPPNKGNKLMVIGTTSEIEFLDSVGFCKTFSHTYNVPTLSREDAKEVLQQLNVFAEGDIDAAADALTDMPIKKLYTSIETAASQWAKRICSGGKKINISDFLNCLKDIGRTSSVTSRLFPNVFHA